MRGDGRRRLDMNLRRKMEEGVGGAGGGGKRLAMRDGGAKNMVL